MKLLRAIAPILSAFPLLLAVAPSQAQTQPARPSNITPTSQATWAQFPVIEAEFKQGCVGQQPIPADRLRVKQNFCQCAFNAYKARYTPQLFTQINNLAGQAGQVGPTLVNVMMKPELDRCIAQTGFRP
ncbi:MAG: hypothetical protein VKJ46_11105 [Leptolyngbyaceae bacterium]|nr:hypothetical protein [Leptolyngbyaceae bacterium]